MLLLHWFCHKLCRPLPPLPCFLFAIETARVLQRKKSKSNRVKKGRKKKGKHEHKHFRKAAPSCCVFVSFFSVRYTAANVERRIPLLLPYLAELALASSVEKKKSYDNGEYRTKEGCRPQYPLFVVFMSGTPPYKKKKKRRKDRLNVYKKNI